MYILISKGIMILMVVWYTNFLGKVIAVVSIHDNIKTALLRTHLSGRGWNLDLAVLRILILYYFLCPGIKLIKKGRPSKPGLHTLSRSISTIRQKMEPMPSFLGISMTFMKYARGLSASLIDTARPTYREQPKWAPVSFFYNQDCLSQNFCVLILILKCSESNRIHSQPF